MSFRDECKKIAKITKPSDSDQSFARAVKPTPKPKVAPASAKGKAKANPKKRPRVSKVKVEDEEDGDDDDDEQGAEDEESEEESEDPVPRKKIPPTDRKRLPKAKLVPRRRTQHPRKSDFLLGPLILSVLLLQLGNAENRTTFVATVWPCLAGQFPGL